MRSGKYYQAVTINGIKHDLHRIIAEQKIGRPLTDDEVVHHINGDIQDNRPENLQVMSREEHGRLHSVGRIMSEETRQKLSEQSKGKPNLSCRKLSESDVEQIIEFANQGLSQRKIAKVFSVDHSAISNIMHYKSYCSATDKLCGRNQAEIGR